MIPISKCQFILYFLKKFVECPIGYIGVNCSDTCTLTFFGHLCSFRCECLKCHHINGCVTGKYITINYHFFLNIKKGIKLFNRTLPLIDLPIFSLRMHEYLPNCMNIHTRHKANFSFLRNMILFICSFKFIIFVKSIFLIAI